MLDEQEIVETRYAVDEDIQAKRAVLARAQAQLPPGRVFPVELPLKAVRRDSNSKDGRRCGT
jgi:hypothetical protein